MPQQLFVFIQLEFPWKLGPADGRYLLRRSEDGEPEHVVVLATLEAAAGRSGRRRRPRAAAGMPRRLRERPRSVPAEPEPAPVSTTRVTVIDPISLSAESQARAWLAELDREREVGAAVTVVNRVIHAHRIAAADPYVHEVTAAQALVIRAGWGEGEQVADGRWLHARGLPWTTAAARAGCASRPRPRPLVGAAPAGAPRGAARRPRRGAPLRGARSARARGPRPRPPGARRTRARSRVRARRPRAAGREPSGSRDPDRRARAAEPGVNAQAQLALVGEHATPDGVDADQPPAALDGDLVAHALGRLEAALRARTAAGRRRLRDVDGPHHNRDRHLERRTLHALRRAA